MSFGCNNREMEIGKLPLNSFQLICSLEPFSRCMYKHASQICLQANIQFNINEE